MLENFYVFNLLLQFAIFVVIICASQAGLAPVSYAGGHGLAGPAGAVFVGGPHGLGGFGPAVPFGPGPFGYAGKAAAEGVDYYVSSNKDVNRYQNFTFHKLSQLNYLRK